MKDPVLRIILVPATSQSRTYEVSYRRLRMLRGFALGLCVAGNPLLVCNTNPQTDCCLDWFIELRPTLI